MPNLPSDYINEIVEVEFPIELSPMAGMLLKISNVMPDFVHIMN